MGMLENLEAMLARGEDNKLLRFALGKACLEDGRPAEAAAHLSRCLAFDREYSAAWKLCGKALAACGHNQDAAKTFHQGIEVARRHGDKQAQKEMEVFLRRLEKQTGE